MTERVYVLLYFSLGQKSIHENDDDDVKVHQHFWEKARSKVNRLF